MTATSGKFTIRLANRQVHQFLISFTLMHSFVNEP
jgi:hypothetical protein